ncbi:hypothetical protein PMZ80_007590 [Knufia obscura]|uniref:Inner centromere protein ARK-binding domain-containing protein n=2 Tax=Knufia TaxID=430999 RepID=A0AAN8EYV8_9EURO|nr:hypothetical protein PMZ80_007590 [Knufia obscura]KAK5954133.1 hypothetical protein OHC33_004705 [Knufia fluminis]
MAATKARVASHDWVLAERQCAHDISLQEYAELGFPAIHHLQWLDEHISELFNASEFKALQAFKTPGKLRGAKTPRFKATTARKEPAVVIEPVQAAPDSPDTPEEEDKDVTPTPTPQAAVQLYTDSDIGSPSTHATPEQPLRKGSFSFAPLPARDPLKQSLGARTTDIKPTTDIPPSSAVQPARQQSLGLDSDDEDSEDAQSVDLRAPELIAHEERMKEYESSSPQRATEPEMLEPQEPEQEEPESEHEHNQSEPEIEEAEPDMPEPEEPREPEEPKELENIIPDTNDASSEHDIPDKEDTQSTSQDTVKETAPTAPRPSQVRPPTSRRLAAPKTFGRPVRATNAAKPQPVPIKIKPLSQPKPVNPAPVAAHNTTKPPSPVEKPKVLSLAEKKKKLDEEAAAKDARVKQQQKERRDNKIEELRRAKEEEEAEKDRRARRNSAEKRKAHIEELNARKKRETSLETRQEREEAVTAAKGKAFREMQQKRQIRPATKPVAKPAVKSAMKPLSTRPQNPPPRPPARLDHHEPSRPASRLGVHDEDMSDMPEKENDLPAYPSNLSKPPVRASIKKPSIFTRTSQNIQQQFPQPPTRVAPQMQQYATQRIPFATEMAQPQRNQENMRPFTQTGPSINTPFAPMRNMHTIQAINDTSPTDITLPEIHTDSSDDSDRNVSLPSWATPGHVFNTLSQQETINPDAIFPRIPTISMDDVFAENPDRLRRLRMRTSSANWVRTGDALTQVEVLEDRIGRAEIRNAGGWVFGYGGRNGQHGN